MPPIKLIMMLMVVLNANTRSTKNWPPTTAIQLTKQQAGIKMA